MVPCVMRPGLHQAQTLQEGDEPAVFRLRSMGPFVYLVRVSGYNGEQNERPAKEASEVSDDQRVPAPASDPRALENHEW